MIWSLAEIWLPLAIAFLLGCAGGSLLFQRIAVSRFAGMQASIHARIDRSLGQFGGTARTPRQERRAAKAAPVQRAQPAPVAPVAESPPPAPPPAPTLEERPQPRATARGARTVELPIVTVPSPDEIAAGRPPALDAPRGGKPDSLRRIKGIGESFEARLHALGIFHFDQIAEWSLKQAAWVAMETGAADRVIRNDWVGQAKAFAEEKRAGGGEA
jgi:predicted flap endonuclease-1-like 5' DNA nuclease